MESELLSLLFGRGRSARSHGWNAVALALVIGLGPAVEAEEKDPVVAANRLENKGIALWRAGNLEAGARLIEESIESDPTNPQRLLNYGSLLMQRGQAQMEAGKAEDAAKSLEESERQLATAVKLAEGLPGRQALAGQGFFLLGEIAFYARKDQERAAKFYLSAAKRLPEDERIRAALDRSGYNPVATGATEAASENDEEIVAEPETAESQPDPEPESQPVPPPVTIGQARTVTMDGRVLRLATEEENQSVRVEEYVPPGETADNWSTLFAKREHRRFVPPDRYASLLSEQAARQGGKVISTAAGPGNSASVVFVIHAPAMQLSEVNAWNLIDRDGVLVSEQFAHRVRGENHYEESERLAREKADSWVRELQARHSVSLVRTSAVSDAGN